MKKIRKFFRKLWLERDDVLHALAYILVTSFGGSMLIIITTLDISLPLKVILFIGEFLLLGLGWIGVHYIFNQD